MQYYAESIYVCTDQKYNEDKFFILNLFAVENNWEVNKHVTKNIT